MGTGSEAKLDFGDVGVEMQLESPVIFKQEYHHQHHHHQHHHQHHHHHHHHHHQISISIYLPLYY